MVTALRFDWDPQKDGANRRKHGIPFAEAEVIFWDENALLLDDPDHSDEEDRFVLLGLSGRLRLLAVVHSYQAHEAVIRIISARKATRREHELYRERLRS